MKYFIIPVLYTMAVSLLLWVGLYDCKSDPNAMGYTFLFDSNRLFSLGNDYLDAMVNGLFFLVFLGTWSYLLLMFTLKYPDALLHVLRISLMVSSNYLPMLFFGDLVVRLNYNENYGTYIIRFCILAIGAIYCILVIKEKIPKNMRQIYTITLCAFVAVYYLRIFPGYTPWFLIGIIVFWDLFAVYSKYGPMHKLEEKFHLINAKILNFVVYTHGVVKEEEETLLINTKNSRTRLDSADSEIEINTIFSDDVSTTIGAYEQSLAYSLYNEGNAHLGLGDFVFFSILACISATHGNMLTSTTTIVGVLSGMFVTELISAPENTYKSAPALPASVGLGLLGHFSALYILNPLVDNLANKCV